jgi:hypothetical protein
MAGRFRTWAIRVIEWVKFVKKCCSCRFRPPLEKGGYWGDFAGDDLPSHAKSLLTSLREREELATGEQFSRKSVPTRLHYVAEFGFELRVSAGGSQNRSALGLAALILRRGEVCGEAR